MFGFGEAIGTFWLGGGVGIERPSASGIFSAGIVVQSPRIDPLLALKPEGATIRSLRLSVRLARKRLRVG